MKKNYTKMPDSARERASKRYKLMWRVGTSLPRHVLDPENPDHKWSLVNGCENLTYQEALERHEDIRMRVLPLDVRIVEQDTPEPPDTVMDKL